MSSNAIPILKFMFKEEFKVLNDTLSSNIASEVKDFANADDLSTYLSTVQAGLIIASLKDRDDLIQIATFMKIFKKVAQETTLKIVVVNFSRDKNFEKAIAKLGILDVFDPKINDKALKFKLDFWMKSINAQIRNNPNSAQQKSVKSIEATKAADKKAENQAAVWIPSLEIEDDIWLTKNDSDCKKVLSKWLIRVLGPSPYVGQWVEAKANYWRFDFKEGSKDLFITGDGSWFFHGDNKPDFVWKENLWIMTGESFDLFYQDKTQTVSRFKSKDKNLTICSNSDYAKTKETIIIESFNKDMVLKREAYRLEDLEGKNKTDKIDGGPLSGKNDGEEAIKGNLSGKTKGEKAIEKGNHSQQTETSKESSHWSGKNSPDKKEEGDGSSVKADGPIAGANLERERKDHDHQKYYKNHNEAEKYEAVEKKEIERQAKNDSSSGPMSGKSSTDELKKNYDNNNVKKDKEKKENELSGDSSTDAIEAYLGQKGKQEAKSAKDQAEHEKLSKEEPVGKGKEKNKPEVTDEASTRKENEKQDSKKSKTAVEKDQDGNHGYTTNGESSTEKLSSHYKSKKSAQPNQEEDDNSEFEETLTNEPRSAGEKAVDDRKKPSKVQSEDDGNSSVLPFINNKESKSPQPKTAEEKEIDDLVQDSKVVAFLTQDNEKISCAMDDFFDDTVIFHTDAQNLKTDNQVHLDLVFNFMNKDTKLKMNGKVLTVEADGDGNNYVTVQLTKENSISFNTFMKLYEVRQDNVNNFLKKVKGL